MSAGRDRRNLADLQTEARRNDPKLDNAATRPVHLPPHRTLRDATGRK